MLGALEVAAAAAAHTLLGKGLHIAGALLKEGAHLEHELLKGVKHVGGAALLETAHFAEKLTATDAKKHVNKVDERHKHYLQAPPRPPHAPARARGPADDGRSDSTPIPTLHARTRTVR